MRYFTSNLKSGPNILPMIKVRIMISEIVLVVLIFEEMFEIPNLTKFTWFHDWTTLNLLKLDGKRAAWKSFFLAKFLIDSNWN